MALPPRPARPPSFFSPPCSAFPFPPRTTFPPPSWVSVRRNVSTPSNGSSSSAWFGPGFSPCPSPRSLPTASFAPCTGPAGFTELLTRQMFHPLLGERWHETPALTICGPEPTQVRLPLRRPRGTTWREALVSFGETKLWRTWEAIGAGGELGERVGERWLWSRPEIGC